MLAVALAIATPPFARVGAATRVATTLARLLHGRLRVAHGPRRGAGQVHHAAAQSVPGVADHSLLLGLLPDAGNGLATCPCAARTESNVPEGQRPDHRHAADVDGFPGGLGRRGLRRWAVACRRPGTHRGRAPRAATRSCRLWGRGQPCARCATSTSTRSPRGTFGGLRLDGLPRCLWYVPQHSMSYALGLDRVDRRRRGRQRRNVGAILAREWRSPARRCSTRSSAAFSRWPGPAAIARRPEAPAARWSSRGHAWQPSPSLLRLRGALPRTW